MPIKVFYCDGRVRLLMLWIRLTFFTWKNYMIYIHTNPCYFLQAQTTSQFVMPSSLATRKWHKKTKLYIWQRQKKHFLSARMWVSSPTSSLTGWRMPFSWQLMESKSSPLFKLSQRLISALCCLCSQSSWNGEVISLCIMNLCIATRGTSCFNGIYLTNKK